MTIDIAQPLTLPIRRTTPFDPPAFYEELRRLEPVRQVLLENGRKAWLVARYVDVRAVLKNPNFSSDPRRSGFPETKEDGEPIFLTELDPPDHTVLRRMLAGEFSPARLALLRDRIRDDADELLTAMLHAGSDADLVSDYAYPIALLTICHLLGVPYADRFFFREKAEMLSGPDEERRANAFADVYAYLRTLVDGKIANPGDDLIGRLVTEQYRSGHIDHDTLLNVAVILLMAGFDTTATTIALGACTLLHFPDQLELFRNREDLTDGAVEEILRFHSIADSDAQRVAIADTVVGNQKISPGEAVIPLIWSANRDADVFEQPDIFDVTRNMQGQLAFGYGIHQCLGLNLARIETRVALRMLFDRIPFLRPARPITQMPFRYESEIFGLHAFPVVWD